MNFLSLCKMTKVSFSEAELPEVQRQFLHQVELSDKLTEVDAETGLRKILPSGRFAELPQEQLPNQMMQNSKYSVKLRKGE